MTVAIEDRGKLDIGRVIQQTAAVLSRNLVTFSVLGLILAGLPTAVVAFFQADLMRDQFSNIQNGNFNFSAGYFQGVGLGGLTAVITGAILQGALIYATVQDLNGQKAGVGDSLATGLRSFLPLIGVSILFTIGCFFGLILLIVPGIMLACAWCVAVPALVADRTGVFGAFGRSADLTRGNRWRIFGLALLLWIVLLVIETVFSAVAGVSDLASATPDMLARLTSPVFIVVTIIRSTIQTVIGAALIAVLYVELRHAREGRGPQWLADIFS